MGFQKILCPVDFSETSWRAVSRAIELARASAGELTLLHVSPLGPGRPAMSLVGGGFSGGLMQVPGGALYPPASDVDPAEAQLEQWCQRVAAEKVACEEPLLVHGDPASEILQTAADGEFDLLVLGTHGKTGVLGALLGSVTYKVVRTASCSVLTVRSA